MQLARFGTECEEVLGLFLPNARLIGSRWLLGEVPRIAFRSYPTMHVIPAGVHETSFVHKGRDIAFGGLQGCNIHIPS
jgi:hypothetical protein